MSSATIGRRLAGGRWVRLMPRVYFAADHQLTVEARLRAAYLWAGPEATVCGVAAAWWHGLRVELPILVDITIPHRRRLPQQPGIRVRRRDLHPADRVNVNEMWVTATALTALEASVEAGSHLLDRLLQRRLTIADLYVAYNRNFGRRGSADIAELLRAAGDRAASEAERLLIALLRGAGLAGWRSGYRVGRYEVDLALPAARVAVEVDGWAWHSDVERFRHDRRRQNELVLAGWTVLRFTWDDLTNRPDAVLSQIRTAIPAA